MAVAMDNAILENILRQVRPLIGQGKVADYIPALATVDGSRLGIAICTVDGQLFQAGDAQERFCIQSISKVLSLVVAMRHYSEEEIWQRVGKDPSGSPFNSLVQHCALKMSCVELARTFVFLANQGKAIHIDEPVVTPMQARQINALMATSGMYQNAGEFAWRVGLPAKSGVGGGIVAIVPHEMAIAVWSPELDDAGNSLAGIAVLEQLTKQLGRSVY